MGYSVALVVIALAIVGFVVLAKRRGWMINESPGDDTEIERGRAAARGSDTLGGGFG